MTIWFSFSTSQLSQFACWLTSAAALHAYVSLRLPCNFCSALSCGRHDSCGCSKKYVYVRVRKCVPKDIQNSCALFFFFLAVTAKGFFRYRNCSHSLAVCVRCVAWEWLCAFVVFVLFTYVGLICSYYQIFIVVIIFVAL